MWWDLVWWGWWVVRDERVVGGGSGVGCGAGVRQLRHYFGPFLTPFLAPLHAPHAACSALLCEHAYRTLMIGA